MAGGMKNISKIGKALLHTTEEDTKTIVKHPNAPPISFHSDIGNSRQLDNEVSLGAPKEFMSGGTGLSTKDAAASIDSEALMRDLKKAEPKSEIEVFKEKLHKNMEKNRVKEAEGREMTPAEFIRALGLDPSRLKDPDKNEEAPPNYKWPEKDVYAEPKKKKKARKFKSLEKI